MKERIGSVILDYSSYCGEDLYSEGSIEDEILEIVKTKNKNEYSKVIAESRNWSVMYHLSPVRGNVVEWLPINKSMNVLEIGAGCGAITGTLASKAGKVTCIELSKKRSLVNAYRNREYDNVEIKVGNFQDIEPELTEKYDYITLIGVFEYAGGYINSQSPYETFLKIVKTHLKENGQLVIAIENQFGLKYWAGCAEDHLGEFYKGIEGYPNVKSVKTFSKKKLEGYAVSAGFHNCEFYYPYPDYKLPLKIFSDQYMPKMGELNNNIRNFDQLRLTMFDESKVFDQVIENEMFDFFSNSYIILLGDREEETEHMIYTKYNERSEQFDLVTSIYEKEGKKYVMKRAHEKEAEEHLQSIYKTYSGLAENYKGTVISVNKCEMVDNILQFEYIEGITLEEKLDKLFRETKSTETVIQSIKEYIDIIKQGMQIVPFEKTEEFIGIFGNVELPEGVEAVKYADIDMLLSNIIINQNEWNLIDYEWTFSVPIPFDFILYRILLNYMCVPNRKGLYDKSSFLSFGIKDQEIQVYEIMERNFQRYVWGEKFTLNENYYKILSLNYQLKDMIISTRIQNEIIDRDLALGVYFDYGEGYEHSFDSRGEKRDGGVYHYEFDVPEKICDIKLDLVMSYARIQVKRFEINGENVNAEEFLKSNGIWEDGWLLYFCPNPWVVCPTNGKKGHVVFEYVKQEDDVFVADLVGKLTQKEQELSAANNIKVAYKKQVDDIYASTSWKITRPLRKIATGFKVLREGGIPAFKQLLIAKFCSQRQPKDDFVRWIEKNERDIFKTKKLAYKPLISVIVPVYNVEEDILKECINSVLDQTYDNWQLCIADDASMWESTVEVLKQYEDDTRIRIVYRKENGHISRATNSAIDVADGEYLAFMDCDDVLAPNALYEVAVKLNEDPSYDFIYSDEDKIDEEGGNRHFPHFKPEWSPDTLMSMMYTSHLGVYRANLVREIGMLREGFEGAQDYDLTLRMTERTDKIGHIDKILYHWRERKGSTSMDVMSKPYILEAQKKAKEEALVRRGLKGTVEFVKEAVQFRVNYIPQGDEFVSIIIPSKDNFNVYKRCVESVIRESTFKNYEIVTVDNGSIHEEKEAYERFCKENKIKYVYEETPFNFSQMCNQGAFYSKGNYLLFLNDDTEVITPDWLQRMVGQASLPHVGAVGAKLYYPGGKKIQHCGVVNRIEGPSHIFCGMDDNIVLDFAKNKLDFNYIAVTGACLMVSKAKFDSIGGFDTDLPIAYNDVDLCFDLVETGYFNVQRNDVQLFHYESLSRGDDRKDPAKFKRLEKERNKLYEKHPGFYNKDWFCIEVR